MASHSETFGRLFTFQKLPFHSMPSAILFKSTCSCLLKLTPCWSASNRDFSITIWFSSIIDPFEKSLEWAKYFSSNSATDLTSVADKTAEPIASASFSCWAFFSKGIFLIFQFERSGMIFNLSG